MAVYCAECGEKLLGAVNRCWSCGKEFVSRTGKSELPPRRRTPLVGPLTNAVEALVLENGAANSELGAASGSTDQPELPAKQWPRRGSPFAGTAAVHADTVVSALSDGPQPTEYPVGGGARGGSIAATLLGCFGILCAFVFPLGGLILAAIGIGLAIWGLNSPHRRPAIGGLLLCCFTFALCVFLVAYNAYENQWR